MNTDATVWDDLNWRGLVALSTDPAAIRESLAAGPITIYCGFDPTAPSLHLGNLVQLLVLRRLQLAGHNVIALVGGSTGLIGDPKPGSERNLNDRETVENWVNLLRAQIGRFLDFQAENPARLVNNLDWTQNLNAIDFLREVGKHFRVNNMIRKEVVKKRLDSEAGISFTEFSYQVLQGFDFLELFRRHGCTMQTGGSDQWGNLTSGTDLIHRVEGKSVHALGTPLILNSDGTKFGKSEGNAIWLDPELTTPYAFFQFWLNTADADVIDRLKIFTFLTREEVEELERATIEQPHLRAAQRRLAWEVTALVHGQEQADQVRDAAAALFGTSDLNRLDLPTLLAATADLPRTEGVEGDEVAGLLVATGLAGSMRQARDLIKQGGVHVNNVRVQSLDTTLGSLLHDRLALLRAGKKRLAVVVRSEN